MAVIIRNSWHRLCSALALKRSIHESIFFYGNSLKAGAAFLFFIFTGASAFASSPRVAIAELRDKSERSYGHGDDCFDRNLWASPGEAFQEMLLHEMAKADGITFVEREHINDIYAHELNDENLEASAAKNKKKFLAADYVIAGTISQFDWCSESLGGGINVGGLLGVEDFGVDAKSSKANVTIDLRLIEAETGKILKTVKGSGQSSEHGVGFSGDMRGVKLGMKAFNQSQLGKVSRVAVEEAAAKLVSAIRELK